MPRRPRKNTTMDQFLTKAAPDAEKLESCLPQEPAAVGAAAQAVEEQGGTPVKKRPRTSTASRTLAPQQLLQVDESVPAAVLQPLSKRRLVATSSGNEAAANTVPASLDTREPPLPLTEEQERLLKDFDLRSRFGAAAGVDRLVRWERAHRLGLNPPDAVQKILLEYAEVPEVRRCVLDAHLLRYDPGGDSGIRC